MDIFKTFTSSSQKQSYGNLGSSNNDLSIQVTTTENHGSISSLSQISVQTKTQTTPFMEVSFHKKKTLTYDSTTISELRLLSESKKQINEENIEVWKKKGSAQNLQISQTSLQAPQKVEFKSSPNCAQIKSNQSIKSSSIYSQGPVQKIKVIKKSRYWQLLQECEKNNKMFIDDQFPFGDKSLGDQKYVSEQKGYAGWERISKIVPKAVFVNSFNAQDAIQGCLNNCYLVSSIASVAKDFPNVFDDIFVSTKINPYGIYMARFYSEGIVVEVVVDDYVPIGAGKQPYYARPSAEKQIWVMILEKCWAKFFKSYQRTNHGLPQQAFYALTGSPFGNKSLLIENASNDYYLQQFLKLSKFQQKGHIFGTCTPPKFKPSKSTPNKQKETDLCQDLALQHAYSVLSIITNPICIIRLRDPRGQALYKRNLTDDLIKQHGEQKTKKYLELLRKQGHDLLSPPTNGIFYMDYRHFMRKFEAITVCQIRNDLNYLSLRCNFTKNKAKFFYFDLMIPSPIIICMSQIFKKLDQNFDGVNKRFYADTKLVLARVINKKNKASQLKNKQSDFESSNDVSIKISSQDKNFISNNQSNSKSSKSNIFEEKFPNYQFLGARSNVCQTAFNFLIFTKPGNPGGEIQRIFESGRYVIYASANIQKVPKKDFTITVHNYDSCFPQQINDFAQLYSERTNPLVSLIGNLGIIDNNQRFEKRWLEDVLFNKASTNIQKLRSLNDFNLVRLRYKQFIDEQIDEKITQIKDKENQSWFSYRIPWVMRSQEIQNVQKMAGFGYFACRLIPSHKSIENFTFEVNQYFGRYVEFLTTDEKFNNKEKTYTMTVKPGQKKIVVLKLVYDLENSQNLKKQYLEKTDNRIQRVPYPARSSVPL